MVRCVYKPARRDMAGLLYKVWCDQGASVFYLEPHCPQFSQGQDRDALQ